MEMKRIVIKAEPRIEIEPVDDMGTMFVKEELGTRINSDFGEQAKSMLDGTWKSTSVTEVGGTRPATEEIKDDTPLIQAAIDSVGPTSALQLPPEPDYNAILSRCGGRLALGDAKVLWRTALAIKAKNITEIGCSDGCSSMLLGLVAKETGGHVWGIEPAPRQKYRVNIDELGLEPYVTSIFAESPWVSPIGKIGLPIDYLFIDGNHQTRWCLMDYHFWIPFVRTGGYVAFHDWTGAKNVGQYIHKAVEIILETDSLIEVAKFEWCDRGIIVFEKPVGLKTRILDK